MVESHLMSRMNLFESHIIDGAHIRSIIFVISSILSLLPPLLFRSRFGLLLLGFLPIILPMHIVPLHESHIINGAHVRSIILMISNIFSLFPAQFLVAGFSLLLLGFHPVILPVNIVLVSLHESPASTHHREPMRVPGLNGGSAVQRTEIRAVSALPRKVPVVVFTMEPEFSPASTHHRKPMRVPGLNGVPLSNALR